MQVFRQIVRVLKTPVTLLLLLAFVGYGAAWGYEHARAPVPGRPPVPCKAMDVGDTLTPQMVQVRVLNGGTKGGMAKTAASHLRAYDFKVIKINNTTERLENTVIVGKDADDPQVQLLTYFFKDAEVRGDGRIDGVVDVLLGTNSVRIPNPKVTTVEVDGPVCLPADTKLPTPTPEPSPSETPTKTKKK
ncbi:MAG: LytR C-terminal domain-containing protein [Propionibacteriaceae bacterium]|nr:LytR C-terminal domain-containing protein [Propionibacteriaceae bacterium]